MHALGEFIQQQMTARGWRQVELVHASGLPKQVISHLLADVELRRMIDPATVADLARAFSADETEQAGYQRAILLKSAEAIGVPVAEPVVVTVPRKPTDAEIAEFLTDLLSGVRTDPAGGTSEPNPSVQAAAPNLSEADKVAGGGGVSGGTATAGDLRDPRRRSHGGDIEQLHERAHAPAGLL